MADINPVSVSGFPDSRAFVDQSEGERIPLVHLMQKDDNEYGIQSIGMTPDQARKVAFSIISAADNAEQGRAYEKERIEI